MMKSILKKIVIKGLAAIAVVGCWVNAWAVTDSEMDEAKAIAAKFYIRYINDGAGYLDNWTPKSMAELEKKVSNKTDKENLRQFKAAAMTKDYGNWDKNELASYWSETFFRENGGNLDSKGASNGLCKKQIRQAIGRMNIAAQAAPAAEPQAAAETPTPEPAAPTAQPITPEELQEAEDIAAAQEIQEAQDMVAEEAMRQEKPEDSGTWVYIMVLAILVAIVIFLVIYASKTMKGKATPAKKREEEIEEEEEETKDEAVSQYIPKPIVPAPRSEVERVEKEDIKPQSHVANDSRMREKYAETLAAKSEEIRSLNRQLAEMETMAASLKEENRKLTAEVEKLRKYATASQPAAQSQSRHREEGKREGHGPHRGHGETHEIYLGRVNSKGIFVRADRHAVDGQSIYRLTTTNGQSGTYTLIHNPLIEEQMLDDPGKWLAGGCFAKDIFDTDGRQSIAMETPGVAVFRDGAWRVERKAKIRYM